MMALITRTSSDRVFVKINLMDEMVIQRMVILMITLV